MVFKNFLDNPSTEYKNKAFRKEAAFIPSTVLNLPSSPLNFEIQKYLVVERRELKSINRLKQLD